jgi:hypothetical protein
MRHRDIENYHVWTGCGRLLDGRPSISSLRDHGEFGMALQKQPKAPAYHVVIIR